MGETTDAVVLPTADERAQFERDRYLIIRNALKPDEVGSDRDTLERVCKAAVGPPVPV